MLTNITGKERDNTTIEILHQGRKATLQLTAGCL
jgi:hypothetical protein